MNKSLRVVDWRTSRYIRDAKRLMTNDTHVHNTHTHTQLFFSPSCRGVWRWLNKFKRWGRTPVCRRPKRWRNKQLLPAFACVGAAELSHTGTTRKINKKRWKLFFFFFGGCRTMEALVLIRGEVGFRLASERVWAGPCTTAACYTDRSRISHHLPPPHGDSHTQCYSPGRSFLSAAAQQNRDLLEKKRQQQQHSTWERERRRHTHTRQPKQMSRTHPRALFFCY